MESNPVSRKRLRNRKRKRQMKKNKRFDRDRLRFEVKIKEQNIISGSSASAFRSKIGKSMDAKAFWENYTTAQQWQQTHNVVWWKSRCLALEEENKILRETMRKLARVRQCRCQRAEQVNGVLNSALYHKMPERSQEEKHAEFQTDIQNRNMSNSRNSWQNFEEEDLEEEYHSDNESIEFQVNEGMMDFLKQSIQHKLELKKQRKEEEDEVEEVKAECTQTRVTRMKNRTENAKLLYGEASPRILGMETALQTTIDSHREKIRPHFWPNIPLKL